MISAQARMAPWRLRRSEPTVRGSSRGSTGPKKEGRTRNRCDKPSHVLSHVCFIFSIAWGTGRATLFTCFSHIIGSSRRQVVERFAGELADHAGRKGSQSLVHTQFYLMDIPKNGRKTRTYSSQWLIFMTVR